MICTGSAYVIGYSPDMRMARLLLGIRLPVFVVCHIDPVLPVASGGFADAKPKDTIVRRSLVQMKDGTQRGKDKTRVVVTGLALSALLFGPIATFGQDVEFKNISLSRAPVYSSCRHRPPGPQYLAIRSWKEWVDYCNSSNPQSTGALKAKPDGPTDPLGKEGQSVFDFDHYTLLVADEGGRANVEPFLVFTGVRDRANEIFVDVLEVTPGKDCVSMATVNPDLHAHALIPRTDKPIHFSISKAVRDCGSVRRLK